MALVLPRPRNDLEVSAHALVRAIEQTTNLARGAPRAPWVLRLLGSLPLGEPDRSRQICAAKLILRAQPELDKAVQFIVMTYVTCFDRAALSPRVILHMDLLLTVSIQLFRIHQTPTGLTLDQWHIIGRDLAETLLAEGESSLRLRLSDIEIFRRLYHQLRIRLFGT